MHKNKSVQIFRDVGQAVSEIYDLPKNGKRVVFCDKTRQLNVNNFFSIRCRKLDDSSYMALNSYYRLLQEI